MAGAVRGPAGVVRRGRVGCGHGVSAARADPAGNGNARPDGSDRDADLHDLQVAADPDRGAGRAQARDVREHQDGAEDRLGGYAVADLQADAGADEYASGGGFWLEGDGGAVPLGLQPGAGAAGRCERPGGAGAEWIRRRGDDAERVPGGVGAGSRPGRGRVRGQPGDVRAAAGKSSSRWLSRGRGWGEIRGVSGGEPDVLPGAPGDGGQ